MSTIQEEITKEITAISRGIGTVIERSIEDLAINRAQYPYVMCIYQNPGCSQEDLGKMLKYKQSIISKTVGILVRNGIIEKVKSDKDRRLDQIYVTAEGEKLGQILSDVICETADVMHSGLTKEAQPYFYFMLKEMRENLEKKYYSQTR